MKVSDKTDKSKNQPVTEKLYGLDHLRAFAIFIVFLYHYGGIFPHPDWVNAISRFGWTGVDLFFVLSGYLISSQLFEKINQQKNVSFKEFFVKRFFRIIPAYLAVVSLYFLFPSLRERESLAPVWKYLVFTQNLGLDIRYNGTFSHAWSLCIEEQFYLFLPLVLITLTRLKLIRKGYIFIIFLFAFTFLARLCSWYFLASPFIDSDNFAIYWYKWIYYPTYCRLDGLLTGVSIAALFQFKPYLKQQLQKNGNLFLLVSLLIMIVAFFVCFNQETFSASVFGFPLVSFGYGIMMVGSISPNSFLYKFGSKITLKIAALSYAIYLTHKIIIHVTQEQFFKLNIGKESNTMFFICIVTSLLGALLLNRIIEKPFLKVRGKILAVKNYKQNKPSMS